MRVVANGEDQIKANVTVFVHMIRRVSGDVDAVFGHDYYRPGIEAVRFHTGTIYGSTIASVLPKIAFSHLASATISCTQDQDVSFHDRSQ